jgi:hypothetical protein
MRLTAPVALRIIREAAKDSGYVVFLGHAERQMKKRRITRPQVLACLSRGVITEGPYLDAKGCWRCRMERTAAGDNVAVAVAIDDEKRLIVVTVF